MKKHYFKRDEKLVLECGFQLVAHNGKNFVGIIEHTLLTEEKIHLNLRLMAEMPTVKIGTIALKGNFEGLYTDLTLTFERAELKRVYRKSYGLVLKFADETLEIIKSQAKVEQIRNALTKPK